MSLFASGNARQAANDTDDGNIGEQLNALIGKAEALMGSLTGDDSTVEQLRERAEKTMRDAKRALAQWQTRAGEAVSDAADGADRYVRDNPWSTVAAVLVAGAVIGALVARSR